MVSDGTTPSACVEGPPHSSEATKTRKVLLVEDQAIIALATAARIRQARYAVENAGSGEAAIRAVENAAEEGRPFNLILMDIDLGVGMDGVETAQRILSKRDVPIIFLTAHAEPEYVERVRRVTRYGYVLKSSGDLILKLSMEMALDLFDAHQEAIMRKQELEIVLAHAPVAMLVVNQNYRVVRVNSRGETMTGTPRSGILERPIGVALRCIHALHHPGGCGNTPDCTNCPLRIIIRDTLENGVTYEEEHIRLSVTTDKADSVDIAVSTALLKQTPHHEALVSVWKPGPGACSQGVHAPDGVG